MGGGCEASCSARLTAVVVEPLVWVLLEGLQLGEGQVGLQDGRSAFAQLGAILMGVVVRPFPWQWTVFPCDWFQAARAAHRLFGWLGGHRESLSSSCGISVTRTISQYG
jgi:hypothetical protein